MLMGVLDVELGDMSLFGDALDVGDWLALDRSGLFVNGVAP